MFIEKRKFKNSKSLSLSAIYEGEDRNASVVVMCHGFHSSKDNPITSRAFAQKLIEQGLSVLRFDFTGHGQSEGDIDDITPLAGLDDLNCAVANLGKKDFALYGSSFGGYVALLYASSHQVLTLAVKAPVSDWSQAQISKDRGKRFREETKNINIYQKAKNIKVSTLIVHGDQDDVVPIEQSKKLLEALGGEKNLSLIHGGTHQMHGPAMEDAHNQLTEFFISKLL